MRKTPGSVTSIFLIILLLAGNIPTLTSIPFIIDIEAFAEKNGLEQNQEEEDKKDYQQRYKHYDFEKYLSHQYEFYKEYTQYYGDLLFNIENSDRNHPVFTDENFEDQDDNRKEKQSDRDDNDDDANGKSDERVSSSDKSEIKPFKYIVVECSNLNIDNYGVEDLSEVEKIINAKDAQSSRYVEKILHQARISENNNNDEDEDEDETNHVKESHIKNNKGDHQEYNIGSDTKIIFLCNNDNLDMDSTNDGNDMMRNSLPSEGIMLPINSLINNDKNDNQVTTTIS
jgi:hypothetical protein